MARFKPLENEASLVKDYQSGAIVNTDKDAYRSAMAKKKKNREILNLKKQIKQLHDRISVLETHILSDINNN